MTHAQEMQEGPHGADITTVVETEQLPFDPEIDTAERARASGPSELSLSGLQLLVALMFVMFTLGLLLRAVIRL